MGKDLKKILRFLQKKLEPRSPSRMFRVPRLRGRQKTASQGKKSRSMGWFFFDFSEKLSWKCIDGRFGIFFTDSLSLSGAL
jgi:hypothetical protein